MRKLIPHMAVLIAVSLAIVFSACSDTRNNRKGQTGSMSGSTMKDSDAENLIKERFKSDPQLSAADIDVSADPDNKELKLSGTVNSEDLRQKAVRIAQSAMPGFTVSDTIDVKPREMARSAYDESRNQGQEMQSGNRGGESGQDSTIRSQIQNKFSSSNMTSFQNVKVDVNNGIVTLSGHVANANEKAQAEKMVQGIDGVKRVDNQLQISGSQSRGQSQSYR